jgi:hypothetical protein
VKYRSDIARFLNADAARFFEHAKNWPDLYLIFVADRREPDRSCFQEMTGDANAPSTCDLHAVRNLNVYRSTVLEFEELVTKLFALMAEHRSMIGTIAKFF